MADSKVYDSIFWISLIAIVTCIVLIGAGIIRTTGYAVNTTYATMNITVSSMTLINFTKSNINFGTGNVNSSTQAVLWSNNLTSAPNGTWTSITGNYLQLDNIGNTNVSVNLSFGQNATTLIGGAGSNQGYYWNLTNLDPGSCNNTSITLNAWYPANTSNITICSPLWRNATNNSIAISIAFVIPTDSKSGVLGDVITAVGTSI